jgi:hypothetical protein
MVKTLVRVVRPECLMVNFGGAEHLCVGRVKRVAVPIGFIARARKPYCEYHAQWVLGK